VKGYNSTLPLFRSVKLMVLT